MLQYDIRAARVTSDQIVNDASLRGDCLAFSITPSSDQRALSIDALLMDCPCMCIAVLYSAPTAFFLHKNRTVAYLYVGN